MKLWFNNKKSEKPAADKQAERAPVGKELSDDLMAQITGGTAADMSQCHKLE